MDITGPGQAAVAPASDDQELAKVLESMNNTLTTAPAGPVTAPDEPADTDPADDGLQFETAPAPMAVQPDEIPSLPQVTIAPVTGVLGTPSDVPELESIKKEALMELRPLVDKLDLSPEDKFDTLLLIIRSTDDKSLVSQAHEAAKSIEDDTRRAEALLDVIKEIDYFSRPQA